MKATQHLKSRTCGRREDIYWHSEHELWSLTNGSGIPGFDIFKSMALNRLSKLSQTQFPHYQFGPYRTEGRQIGLYEYLT